MERINRNSLPGVHLTAEEIKKFQDIYKAKFNIILSDKEALDYGSSLISFMKASLHIPQK